MQTPETANSNGVPKTNPVLDLQAALKATPINQITDLDIVRDRYIKNYNACNIEKVGELMYHKNQLHFKMAFMANTQLQKCDPFSAYAAFVTAAANGYSLDPSDNEVYLIPRGGKVCLDKQAGAYVRKLKRSAQIYYMDQAKLVYQGDIIEVEGGRVVRHVETFKSDIIILGYVRIQLDESGADRYFIYRKSDWESWRQKSDNPSTILKTKYQSTDTYVAKSLWDGGEIGGKQPDPNFLRTKIIKHAVKEKCWASGSSPVNAESFPDVEIDINSEDIRTAFLGASQPEGTTTSQLAGSASSKPADKPEQKLTPPSVDQEEDFNDNPKKDGGVNVMDEDF